MVLANGQTHVNSELYARARAQFKYFQDQELIFMENAGGSQVSSPMLLMPIPVLPSTDALVSSHPTAPYH